MCKEETKLIFILRRRPREDTLFILTKTFQVTHQLTRTCVCCGTKEALTSCQPTCAGSRLTLSHVNIVYSDAWMISTAIWSTTTTVRAWQTCLRIESCKTWTCRGGEYPWGDDLAITARLLLLRKSPQIPVRPQKVYTCQTSCTT